MRLWPGLRRFLGLATPRGQFDSPPRPIDQVILEMSGRGTAPRVGRTEALSVPAVQRGRNLVCSISTLPLVQLNARQDVVRNPLLEQLDPDVPNVVTLAQTLEDLLFESIGWWLITAQDFAGYPIAVRHLDVGSVSLKPPRAAGSPSPLPSGQDPRGATVWVDGVETPASRVIRFDSPNPAVLKVGGRAIRRAILLDQAAAMYADDPRPADYFSPADGADPVDDDEVTDILAQWKTARKRRSTAWVPAAMKYNTVDSPSPADLQLVELQKQAGLEIANALGIDPEELGISTTSRTYFNAIDRRQSRINDVLSPFMRAITDRLSMGDVTRRGHKVVFDLDDYMRADPLTRVQYYQGLKTLGAITSEEIRAEEGLPPLPVDAQPDPAPPADPTPDVAPETEDATVDASRLASLKLDGDRPLQFADVPVAQFTVNRQSRTIEGLALPYGVTGSKYGMKFRFVKGALKWTSVNRVKLLRDHDMGQPLGKAIDLTDTAAGLRVKFKVARGPEGDRALELAEDGVLDGLSVGVDFDAAGQEMDPADESVMLVRRADLREVSLTAMPLFDDARVSKVAASRTEGTQMEECATCGQRHAPGAACPTTQTPPANQPQQPASLRLNDDQLRALVANPAALAALVGMPSPQQQPHGFALTSEQINALAEGGHLRTLLGIGAPAPAPTQPTEQEPARQTVDPTRRTVTAAVDEAMPYRFDRRGNLTRGTQYDFSSDVIAGLRDGNGEALRRAESFVRAQFDTDMADAATLNPNVNRPDLYVDQKEFAYPIWDAISKGTIADATPFVLPKFSTSSGMVAAHVEGTEPSLGTFTATSQTITPSAVSGKVSVTREAWDQGGNPQLSGLIWNQMIRAWYEALEASAVALLDGLTPTGITISTAAADDVLVGELEAALAALQYVRGGFRMRDLFLQVDLYKSLIAATDADGRKLLPYLNPVNASGQVSDFFGDVMVGGLRGRPAWALAASGTVAASSYLFDRNDVSGWATAPQRLTFETVEVRYVHVGIWGYKALANTDLTGVREIIYDPA